MRDLISKNFLPLIIIALLVVLMVQRCGSNGQDRRNTSDTVTKVVTVQIPQPPVFIPQYTPVQTSSTQPIVIPSQYRPSDDLQQLMTQYNELVTKYLSMNTYKDSITLKDTAGNRVGVVNIEDAISENKIQSRKPDYQLYFPQTTITTTITNKIYEKTRQLYIGGDIMGNKDNYINQVSLGLLYKDKKDRLGGIKIGLDSKANMYYGVQMYFKLHK